MGGLGSRATLRGLLAIVGLGLLAVIIGTVTLAEGRDQLCDALGVLPGVDCGPANDPDPSALTAPVLLVVGALALAMLRWRMLRSWRQNVHAGGARPATFWPISLARNALLVLAPTVFLVVTASAETDLDSSLRAWPVFLFTALMLAFAVLETLWAWRRLLARTTRRAGRAALADVMASGGGWCRFDAAVGGLADGRPPTPAPISGEACVAWAVGAEMHQHTIETETREWLTYAQAPDPPLRNDGIFGAPDDGRTVREELVSVDERSGTCEVRVDATWSEFHYVECSSDPFTVVADGATLVLDPATIVIVPAETSRHALSEKHDRDWFEYLRRVTTVEERGSVDASLGLFRPGDRVVVEGCVYPNEGRWQVASIEEADPHLTHRIAPELARELVAGVESR